MKILIVEDDLLLSKTIAFKLSKEGYEVEIRQNGLEAIAGFDSILPDLVLTDIMMPISNGLDVVNHVKNHLKSKIPVVVLSSAKHQNMIDNAREIGADDFISKPFSPDFLVQKLASFSKIAAA